MQGRIESFELECRSITVYLPPQGSHACGTAPAVYCLADDEFSASIPTLMEELEPSFGQGISPFYLVLVPPVSWDDEFTPWPASPAAGRKEPFGGKADVFLTWLSKTVKPFVESCFPVDAAPEKSGLIGYSLGGLAALYAAYRFSEFGRFGSVSGSLWYPGWKEYMAAYEPLRPGAKIYLSLGAKEERTKDLLLAEVGEAIRAAERLLKGQLANPRNCKLEWNKGGHFGNAANRIRKALVWLMEENR